MIPLPRCSEEAGAIDANPLQTRQRPWPDYCRRAPAAAGRYRMGASAVRQRAQCRQDSLEPQQSPLLRREHRALSRRRPNLADDLLKIGTDRPNSQLFLEILPVNLAAPAAMPHTISIELRPNELASPRIRVGLMTFPKTRTNRLRWRAASLHTHLRDEI